MNHFAVHLKLTQYCKSKKPKNQKTNPPQNMQIKNIPSPKKKKSLKFFVYSVLYFSLEWVGVYICFIT